ncbi:hypothetical protein [Quadrisphaera sp. DSM 44207]|uniref:hypothetical protein n=1 Tax=Quadrisphaera sp. DSM 44207 TaxID=1881057 RepID=UPI0008923F30|nr:hypothetical protein [Quadrisphaera sp. DSM 44207]SDQ78368.1 Adenylate kinase [Quadrisphaera sp. DSM 44207]
MPLLDADAPLPHRPRRVLVAGTSGSGKTTLAACAAPVLGVPHVEIDALFHGPGWTPRETFAADVAAFAAGPAWTTEWQYSAARPLLAERADLLVWLDLPRATVLRQVVRRTLVRRLRRQVLWNGNLEPPLHHFVTDRDHIVRWAWRTHGLIGPRIEALLRQRPDLVIVRLRSRAEVERWTGRVLEPAAAGPRPPRATGQP